MRVSILGGGPVALYLGYLLRRRCREVRVVGQNVPDPTFGFGVEAARPRGDGRRQSRA